MLHALWKAQSHALQAVDGGISLVSTAYVLQGGILCADARGSHPPRVQRFVTLLPIKMHSVLKNWIKPIEIQCSLMLSLDPFSI